jgi:glycosyltransferase involved in cell wall biosynthesis
MKISVCLPAFGREKMLQQAIHSVLLQEHEDWEIVIRDDGSDPPLHTHPELTKLFTFIGPRLKYIHEPHIGSFSGVANGTVKHSTGEIIHVMGSDDVLAPSALYAVNQTFQEHYNTTTRGPIWAFGKTLSTKSHLQFDGMDGEPISYGSLLGRNSIGCPSVFWNRAIMNTVGRFDPRFKWAADYDMWLRFYECVPPLFINQELGIYRHHDDRMSVEQAAEIEREAKIVSRRHKQFKNIINRAHRRWVARSDYDGEPAPLSHDDV